MLLLDELDEMAGVKEVGTCNINQGMIKRTKSNHRIGIETFASKKLHSKCLEQNCRAKQQEP